MNFGMCKKSTKNEKSSRLGRPWALYCATLGRVGGRGGRPGNLFWEVLGQVLGTGFDTPAAPLLRDGVGGFLRRCLMPPTPEEIRETVGGRGETL